MLNLDLISTTQVVKNLHALSNIQFILYTDSLYFTSKVNDYLTDVFTLNLHFTVCEKTVT